MHLSDDGAQVAPLDSERSNIHELVPVGDEANFSVRRDLVTNGSKSFDESTRRQFGPQMRRLTVQRIELLAPLNLLAQLPSPQGFEDFRIVFCFRLRTLPQRELLFQPRAKVVV